MARTGRKLTGAQKRAWAEEFDRQKKAGARMRHVGGMVMARADNGWFQRNGDACPGKGFDAQAVEGIAPEYDKPPRWKTKPPGTRLFVWGSR